MVRLAVCPPSPRTREYRFTEWTKWNGSALAPDHTPAGLVGVELYSHRDVGAAYSFDEFEAGLDVLWVKQCFCG